MEVRTSVTAVTVLLALCSVAVTGDEYVPAKIYIDSNPGPTYDAEGARRQEEVDSDVDELLMTVIARLMKSINPAKLDKSTSHRLLQAISGLSPPQQTHLNKALLHADLDITTSNSLAPEDKRSRCRGKCRNVGGLNPNANLRPLPFGKRSRYSGSHASSSSSSLSDFSNKRGRNVKNRLRERVPHFLPFGRR